MDSTVFWCDLAQIIDEESIISADEILRKAFKINDCFLSILYKD